MHSEYLSSRHKAHATMNFRWSRSVVFIRKCRTTFALISFEFVLPRPSRFAIWTNPCSSVSALVDDIQETEYGVLRLLSRYESSNAICVFPTPPKPEMAAFRVARSLLRTMASSLESSSSRPRNRGLRPNCTMKTGSDQTRPELLSTIIGSLDNGVFAYAAAVIAAYPCHSFDLWESQKSHIPRMTRQGI
jgi:hypothetical protein